MSRHEDCIFLAEDDCPKDEVEILCADCKEHKYYNEIEQAINDFVSLGEVFTDLFKIFEQIRGFKGKAINLTLKEKTLPICQRVMTALLTTKEQFDANEIIYRRMIFYLFGIMIDEFKENEYNEDHFTH